MKKEIKEYNKVIILLIVVLIIFAIIFTIIGFTKENHIISSFNSYKNVSEKINNKESFNLILIKKDSSMNKVFDYYEDVYSLKFERLYIDKDSEECKELMKKLNLDINEDDDTIIQIIKNGVPNYIMKGLFSENDLRKALLKQNVLGKEYKEIDAPITNNLKNYKDAKSYSILYINSDNKLLYDYRKKLVKNKIKSFILYTGSGDNKEVESLHKELGFNNSVNDKLPVLIKIKNGKILYYYSNVKLDELIKKANLQD